MVQSNVILVNNREIFDSQIMDYFSELSSLIFPDDLSPKDLMLFQKKLDLIRTDVLFDYGIIEGELLRYKNILKAKREIVYNELRDKALKDDPKLKITDAICTSFVSAFLDTNAYEYSMSLPSIVNELLYREAALRGVVDIVKGKQEAIWIPNAQLKHEINLSK